MSIRIHLLTGCGYITLQWRHNGRNDVSNHQPHDCFLDRLFRRRSKKTSKLRVTDLCAGNSPGPVNSPHKWPVTRKMFPFDDVIMRRSTQWPTEFCLCGFIGGIQSISSIHLTMQGLYITWLSCHVIEFIIKPLCFHFQCSHTITCLESNVRAHLRGLSNRYITLLCVCRETSGKHAAAIILLQPYHPHIKLIQNIRSTLITATW